MNTRPATGHPDAPRDTPDAQHRTARPGTPRPGTLRRGLAWSLGLLCVTGVQACAVTGASQREAEISLPGDAETALYAQHLFTLANEYMEGRKPGTPGIEKAAAYIEFHYDRLGLEPLFSTDTVTPTYRQPFPIGDHAVLESQALTMRTANARKTFVPGEDFNALAYGSSGDVTLGVTFVGYSIPAGVDGYSSYDGQTDLTGQAAMMLRYEPMDASGESLWADEGWSFAASLVSKFRAAESRGAEAILLVNPPDAEGEYADVLETVATSQGTRALDIPIVHITPGTADRLIRAGGAGTLEGLIAEANRGTAIHGLDGVDLSIVASIGREPILTSNIGAVLPGKGDLADEYVVVGAHYDHLGIASFGSRFPGELHLGADDNASGTSGLLTSAELLAEAWDRIDGPVRSVLFLAFSAEESGLIGSRHYVDNPALPLEDISLMLNMDMIGSLGSTLEAGGVGTGVGLGEFAQPLFEKSGLDVKTSLSVGSGRSDHASFDAKDIPNIFFFTGITDQYHTPDDKADTINTEGGARIASLAADLILATALRDERFAYAEQESGDEPPRRRMGGPGAVKVRVGIAPGDYSGSAGGIMVARVFEGTSADDAGLQEGDRITVWDGEQVKTVQDWMPLLASHEPGDEIEITIIRDGEEVTLPMTLKARRTTGG